MHIKPTLLVAAMVANGVLSAQNEIMTLQVAPPDDPFGSPIVALDDPGSYVVVQFDQLADERAYLRYELVHCDAEWKPSGLTDPEFIDGFNEGVIEDYDFSNVTTVPYVHYWFTLPNEQMRVTAPGNYLIRIFDEQDRDATLAEGRFMVCDYTMRVGGEVTSRTDIDGNDRHQQLSLVVDTRQTAIRDPFNDLKVVVTQNDRTDNTVTVSHPARMQGDKLIFEHDRNLIFPAGNEYRRMEIVSVNVPSMHVECMAYDHPLYQALLETDVPRAGNMYLYDQTHHGKSFIRQYESRGDSQLDADYVAVHFRLQAPELRNAQIHIEGDLTGRRFSPESLMTYDADEGMYKATLLLKQGAYDYQYVAVPGGTAPIEGDKYQTVNQYEVRVYHRPPGTRYDRLVAVARFNSL